MRPAKYPLALYRGDSYTWRFRFWNDLAKTEPTDFTGCTAEAEVRNRSAGDVIMTMTCMISTNEIDVVLTADDWADWAGTTGKWDLQVTYPGGEVVTYVADDVTVEGDVVDSEPLGSSGSSGQALSRAN